jgi:hypothetical protein
MKMRDLIESQLSEDDTLSDVLAAKDAASGGSDTYQQFITNLRHKKGESYSTEVHHQVQKHMSNQQDSITEAGMPAGVIKIKEKIRGMTPEQKKEYFKGRSVEDLKSMAWRHGYGKGSTEYSKHATIDE